MRKQIPIEANDNKRSQSQLVFCQEINYEQLNDLTHGQYSRNSLLSMQNDWNRFVIFCQLKQLCPLPAQVDTVKLFIEHEANERKFASIRRYRLTIALLHKLHALEDPCAHRQIHFLFSQLQLDKKGDAKQATAFTKHHLEQLNQLLINSTSLLDRRDRLIYYFMFECALKRSQLRLLTRQQLIRSPNGSYKITIESQTYPLSDELSQQIDAWLQLLPTQAEVLFVRIDKHENMGIKPMDDSSIYRVFRRASERLNLPNHQQFSGQSSRIGAAKELYAQGFQLKAIQEFGRWVSPVMPAQYLGKYELAEQEQLLFKKPKEWK